MTKRSNAVLSLLTHWLYFRMGYALTAAQDQPSAQQHSSQARLPVPTIHPSREPSLMAGPHGKLKRRQGLLKHE